MSALNATSRAECVCNWGDDCLRFREHFNKILETDGQCLFAGTYRPNLTAGPKQANFFDAVDRHLKTRRDLREKAKGQVYCITLHHWPANVLEHFKDSKAKSLMFPVSSLVTVAQTTAATRLILMLINCLIWTILMIS